MNIFFKEIQRSFDLLDQKKTKKYSFIATVEYMLKIANESEYEVEKCTITSNKDGIILTQLSTKESTLSIIATPQISYKGTGPKKEDIISTINVNSDYVREEVFEWIQRNHKLC